MYVIYPHCKSQRFAGGICRGIRVYREFKEEISELRRPTELYSFRPQNVGIYRCGCTLYYESGPYMMCHKCYPRPVKVGRLNEEQWERLRRLFPVRHFSPRLIPADHSLYDLPSLEFNLRTEGCELLYSQLLAQISSPLL